jgi:dUTP pyrophosphatase
MCLSRGVVAVGGVIDTDYTGEICVILANICNEKAVFIEQGERVAQLLVHPCTRLIEKWKGETYLAERPATRGDNGFGSSGL